MVNIHKLKHSKKNMSDHLRNLYLKREELLKKLDSVSKLISHLETARNNCQGRIKNMKRERGMRAK